MPESRTEGPTRVGIRELRNNLSGLLRQARRGTTFLVMSRNEVVAQIQPPPLGDRPPRVPGRLNGQIRMADDFDELPDDILAAIEGEAD